METDFFSMWKYKHLGFILYHLLERDLKSGYLDILPGQELALCGSELGGYRFIPSGGLVEGLSMYIAKPWAEKPTNDILAGDFDQMYEIMRNFIQITPIHKPYVYEKTRPYKAILLPAEDPGFVYLHMERSELQKLATEKDRHGVPDEDKELAEFLISCMVHIDPSTENITFEGMFQKSSSKTMSFISSGLMKNKLTQIMNQEEFPVNNTKRHYLPASTPVVSCWDLSMDRPAAEDADVSGDERFRTGIKVETTVALKVDEFPTHCLGWVKRAVKCGWPSKELLTDILQSGCHIVEKQPSQEYDVNSGLKWRLSFSIAETTIAQNLTSAQRRCLVAMKLILKANLAHMHAISTYHCKTAFYWLCQKMPEAILDSDALSVVNGFTLLLNDLITYVGCGHLPNFFVPTQNLFRNVPRDTLRTIAKVLIDIRKDPMRYLKCAHQQLFDTGYVSCTFDQKFSEIEKAEKMKNVKYNETFQKAFTDMFTEVTDGNLQIEYMTTMLKLLWFCEKSDAVRDVKIAYLVEILGHNLDKSPSLEDADWVLMQFEAICGDAVSQELQREEILNILLQSALIKLTIAKQDTTDEDERQECLVEGKHRIEQYLEIQDDKLGTLVNGMFLLDMKHVEEAEYQIEECLSASVTKDIVPLCRIYKELFDENLQRFICSESHTYNLPVAALASYMLVYESCKGTQPDGQKAEKYARHLEKYIAKNRKMILSTKDSMKIHLVQRCQYTLLCCYKLMQMDDMVEKTQLAVVKLDNDISDIMNSHVEKNMEFWDHVRM